MQRGEKSYTSEQISNSDPNLSGTEGALPSTDNLRNETVHRGEPVVFVPKFATLYMPNYEISLRERCVMFCVDSHTVIRR